jgi:hypothetical protein
MFTYVHTTVTFSRCCATGSLPYIVREQRNSGNYYHRGAVEIQQEFRDSTGELHEIK